MALSGRGGVRGDTRTTRLERLHRPQADPGSRHKSTVAPLPRDLADVAHSILPPGERSRPKLLCNGNLTPSIMGHHGEPPRGRYCGPILSPASTTGKGVP